MIQDSQAIADKLDTLYHNILLHKLDHGIRGWQNNYLNVISPTDNNL